ncbi:TPA: hypothetical protein SHX40_004492 [Escherichia coli]|nr:hypothetical protein [Salmonella enterica]EFW7512621.1 hypothetical protein [Shigella sonnei]EGK8975448.1 hypothetical protein [Escherichia coli]ELU6348852.1 hypothetical protein [Salmonella enterica]HEH7466542.1 hypothetical protein [Escherichia coli]
MPHGKVIFNKKGRWDWLDRTCDVSKEELDQEEWFIADMYYPPDENYDPSMHEQQIQGFLSKPDELVRYDR